MKLAQKSLAKRDYAQMFQFDGNNLVLPETGARYAPEQIFLVELHRFKAKRPPGSTTIIYVLETFDNIKGILVSTFSNFSSIDLVSFLNKVRVKAQGAIS